MSVSTDAKPDVKVAQIALAEILGPAVRELDIPRHKRIYTNRNLRMDEIKMVGFDMDYTLAIYHQAEMEKLSIELTLKKLVGGRGYPPEILALTYAPEWAIRGLMIDRIQGNVFKMDRHGHVGRVYHGSRMLTREERTALYRKERIKLSLPRYAWIDTLFALPEAVMYLRLVEFFEQTGQAGKRIKYTKLWDDIRECIDEAHRDDSLKSVIRSQLGRFIQDDPELPATLHKFRSSGKKLFLLTNSLWDYTDAVMRYLLDGKLPTYPSWRSYFDIVVVGGSKPAFFTDRNAFVEIDPATGAKIGEVKKGGLLRGHVYQAGNLADFEAMSGFTGDRVLYIGDHIYGDILRAKKSSVWRTAMIVQELEQEIALMTDLGHEIRQLDEMDRKRRNLEAEVDYQQLLLRSLQRMEETGQVNEHNAAAIDKAKKQAKRTLDDLRGAARAVGEEYDRLEDAVDAKHNRWWGPMFKEGNENSRFGEQVEDYACLYTGRVSNFLGYSPLRYFRAPRDKMPHEL
jgi:HAD superfamily 5'-nucleotidase-like hydrolase